MTKTQCRTEWKGFRCRRVTGHKGKHSFETPWGLKAKTGTEVLKSNSARKTCTATKKWTFPDYFKAKLYCFKREMEMGDRLVPYVCPCGKFHITSRFGKLEES